MSAWRNLLNYLFGSTSKTPEPESPRRKSAEPASYSAPQPKAERDKQHQLPPEPPPEPADIKQKPRAMPRPIPRSDAPSRPEPKPRKDGPRAITIGLDFGTHSTKIILRPRGADKGSVLQICKSPTGYPTFGCPSIVKVVGERVYFGPQALGTPGGKLYRSLKVQLLPPLGHELTDDVFPAGLTPDLLVAWYLSWVLDRIKRGIEKFLPGSAPKLSLNMAAPMDHIENEALKTRYLGIVQAAWESVFGTEAMPAQQGMDVRELRAVFSPWLEREVPGREVRPFEVLPETVAPIVSLSRDPRMAPGMCMIVDMGAGTTEMSVNYVQEPGADQRIVCYQDRSERLGGDHFEWLRRQHTDPAAVRRETSELVERFMKVFRSSWVKGYQKDARNRAACKKWARFDVVLAGGGARHSAVETAIRTAMPFPPWPVGEDHYRTKWHEPADIHMQALGDGESTALLAVANGLSVPRQQWPDFFPPGEVEDHEPPEMIEPLPAYWYVD